jgi:hypothetical protein
MTNNHLASLVALLTTACLGSPALAQDFLTTQTATPPTFLNNALSSTAATGAASNSSNLTTGPQALNAGVLGGNTYSLPSAGYANLAPNSVSQAAFPSGTFSYGFNQPGPISINLGASGNQYGFFGGQALPTVSTGSSDINTVDCPYLRSSGLGGTVSPWTLNLTIPGLNTQVNLSETAAAASSFLNGIGL